MTSRSMYLNSKWQALPAERDPIHGTQTPIETENGNLVALVCGTTGDPDCAGAVYAISATQEMLVALEDFIAAYDHKSHANCDTRLCDALDKAKAAVAKALGSDCVDDKHRGTECRCGHVIRHCCSHHCCCFD
jgi:hypothetical protein